MYQTDVGKTVEDGDLPPLFSDMPMISAFWEAISQYVRIITNLKLPMTPE